MATGGGDGGQVVGELRGHRVEELQVGRVGAEEVGHHQRELLVADVRGSESAPVVHHLLLMGKWVYHFHEGKLAL